MEWGKELRGTCVPPHPACGPTAKVRGRQLWGWCALPPPIGATMVRGRQLSGKRTHPPPAGRHSAIMVLGRQLRGY